jgi:RimJ/RimL family protein N-acetyltransferase
LYEHAVQVARDAGRRRLMGEYPVALPGGPPRSDEHARFAKAVGAREALPEVRRRLRLAEVDQTDWSRLRDQAGAHAQGYTLVQWTTTVPDEYLDDVATLDSRLLQDAPLGTLALEPQRVDAQRVRAIEATSAARGQRRYHTGARHDASGRLVAWTAVGFDGDATEHAWQQITIVHPAHRGHRLGLLVKLDNLRQVCQAEPGCRYLDTWNAAENHHMIAINEAIGFRPVDGWVGWQHDLA